MRVWPASCSRTTCDCQIFSNMDCGVGEWQEDMDGAQDDVLTTHHATTPSPRKFVIHERCNANDDGRTFFPRIGFRLGRPLRKLFSTFSFQEHACCSPPPHC